MIKKFKFDKLVRDKTQQRLEKRGATVHLKEIANQSELIAYFKKKIIEEAQEVVDATTQENLVEEVADCLEVLYAFANLLSIDADTIAQEKMKKNEIRGAFTRHLIIDAISVPANNPVAQYYNEQPEKYPEIIE